MKKYLLPNIVLLFAVGCGVSSEQGASTMLPGAPFQANSPVYEFEGRYKVGNTCCTVNPIKMAFKVNWKQGKGVMTFFFDTTTSNGNAVFVSEKLAKGRDKFVFDDDQYNTGKFIRADGAVFPVERFQDQQYRCNP